MEKDRNELRVLSHLMMVITIIGFSIILLIMNFLLGWDKWTIPLFVFAMVYSIGICLETEKAIPSSAKRSVTEVPP